jgi:hypothetical protein
MLVTAVIELVDDSLRSVSLLDSNCEMPSSKDFVRPSVNIFCATDGIGRPA